MKIRSNASAAHRLVDIVDIGSDATGMGKTVLTDRIRHFYLETARPVRLVRIETGRRQATQPGVSEPDVFIATEDFASAGTQTGGLVGVLDPLFEIILASAKDGSATVVDWPGGQTTHRLQVLAATRFDTVLASMNLRGLSLVVTSCAADHMAQARSYLGKLKEVVPGLGRGLVLSERSGPFKFAKGSEQAEVMADLLAEAADIPMMRVQHVAGRALQVCADAGLDVAQAIKLPTAELSKRIRAHQFLATSCATELAMFWESTRQELDRTLRVVDAPPA